MGRQVSQTGQSTGKTLVALVAGLGVACGTVTPLTPGPYWHVPRPVLPEANVHGPIVEHVRVAGFSNFNYGATSAAAARAGSAASSAASSVAVNSTSVAFEHYESDDLEQLTIKLLEDTGTITKIYPGAAVELKGVGGIPESDVGWKGAWNFVAVFSLTAFLGMPLYWEGASTVELRLYRDHQFLRTYVGNGRCSAFGTLYYFQYNSITWLRGAQGGLLGSCAAASAVGNAILKVQQEPPDLAATANPRYTASFVAH